MTCNLSSGGGARDLAEEIKGGMSGQPVYKTNDL